jgi:branched-chain amino acid transport system substrate-binding protein
MVAAGLDCKLMVPDACYEEAFITSAGAENLNDRCYVTFGGLPADQLTGSGAKFVETYRRQFGGDPESYAVYGYEAGKVAIEAIRRAGVKDRRAILDACLAIQDFDGGALGTWSFDVNGDTTLRTVSGNIIHDGAFTFVKLLGE